MRTTPINTTINTTMDRDDLLSEEGATFVRELDALVRELERRKLPVTSWYGGLPEPGFELSAQGLRAMVKRLPTSSIAAAGTTSPRRVAQ